MRRGKSENGCSAALPNRKPEHEAMTNTYVIFLKKHIEFTLWRQQFTGMTKIIRNEEVFLD